MQGAENSPVPMQVCRGRHSSPTALASAAHTLLFLLYKLPDRTLHGFAAGEIYVFLLVKMHVLLILKHPARPHASCK